MARARRAPLSQQIRWFNVALSVLKGLNLSCTLLQNFWDVPIDSISQCTGLSRLGKIHIASQGPQSGRSIYIFCITLATGVYCFL
ncbi:Uncharacterized protein HZ326_19726 [Fusarium oxysporum f. sp. albedinis]|nr:Uncharacterized protein HZ326_19726 [Fusarium oxysporum f. sp. albedinis]